MNRVLDWKPQFDDRSLAYPARTLTLAAAPRNCRWRTGPVLDQGSEGACVGFGWSGELAATPKVVGVSNTYAQALYKEAQFLDEWEGESYEGTSVLAGAKAVQGRGLIGNYHWCFSLNDILIALSWSGPVVLGVNWYDGMWDTDTQGFIHPIGQIVGGHCVVATAISVANHTVTIRNSWGSGWGTDGNALITWDELEKLLLEGGEACVPTGRKSGPVAMAKERSPWWQRIIRLFFAKGEDV